MNLKTSGHLVHCWGDTVTWSLWKPPGSASSKWHTEPPRDPGSPLPGLFYIFQKSGDEAPTDIYTLMFIATSFTMAERQKPPKCLSTDEWIKKYGICIQGHIIQSKKGGNSDTSYGMDETWKHSLSELSQSRKDEYHRLLLMGDTESSQIHRDSK